MEYRIFNDTCIKGKDERSRCRNLIKNQISRLESINTGYPKNLILNIHFNREGKGQYLLTGIIRYKQGAVLVKQSGFEIEAVIHSLFDRLKLAQSKKLHKIRREKAKGGKNNRALIFKESLPELVELKTEGSDELLKDLLKVLLGDLAKYIRRRLRIAEMTTAVKRGRFKLQELLDEIYILIYERINEIPDDEMESRVWLYRITDEFLEDKLEELVFENENIERIDNIIDDEYKELEQKFTVNAEYDIVPLEEINEFENQKSFYSVNDLQYGKDEQSALDDIILKLDEGIIHNIVEKELAKLPVFKRTIMDLYLVAQMSPQEISKVKNVSETAIETVIREVNNLLKRKLSFLL